MISSRWPASTSCINDTYIYFSPFQEIHNEKFMPTIDNLQLNSFGHE